MPAPGTEMLQQYVPGPKCLLATFEETAKRSRTVQTRTQCLRWAVGGVGVYQTPLLSPWLATGVKIPPVFGAEKRQRRTVTQIYRRRWASVLFLLVKQTQRGHLDES